jgi:hypothetical protein
MPLYPPLVTSSGQVVVSRSGLPFCNELVATLAYIPMSVTNSATIATSTLLQQYITVDLSGASQYINPDLSNLSIVDSAFATLTSWRESGTTNTGNASWWVLIPSGIPASSEIGLAVMINTSGGNVVDGVTTGISPVVAQQLGLAYGTDDNGANVFNFYDNFAGTTLSSKWVNNTANAGGTLTINNGMSYVRGTNGSGVFIYTTSTFSEGIYETYGNIPSGGLSGSSTYAGFGLADSSDINDNMSAVGDFNAVYGLRTSDSSGSNKVVSGLSGGTYVWQVIIPSSSPTTIYASQNYGNQISSSTDMPTLPQPIVFYDQVNTGINLEPFYWVRVRTYVSTMPSVTVDPLTIYYATLTNF